MWSLQAYSDRLNADTIRRTSVIASIPNIPVPTNGFSTFLFLVGLFLQHLHQLMPHENMGWKQFAANVHVMAQKGRRGVFLFLNPGWLDTQFPIFVQQTNGLLGFLFHALLSTMFDSFSVLLSNFPAGKTARGSVWPGQNQTGLFCPSFSTASSVGRRRNNPWSIRTILQPTRKNHETVSTVSSPAYVPFQMFLFCILEP